MSIKKPNYELKSRVLNEYPNLLKDAKHASMCLYKKDHLYNFNTGEIKMTFNDAIQFSKSRVDNDIIDEAFKLNNNFYCRNKRLNKRIKNMLEMGQCIFLTLTFDDKTLESTSDETRRCYVVRYLKEQCNCFVANIDFGKKNGREHYHAVVFPKNIKVDYSAWTCGSINGEKIRLKDKTDVKLSKYVAKLSNHAIKSTTKRSVLIYSR